MIIIIVIEKQVTIWIYIFVRMCMCCVYCNNSMVPAELNGSLCEINNVCNPFSYLQKTQQQPTKIIMASENRKSGYEREKKIR